MQSKEISNMLSSTSRRIWQRWLELSARSIGILCYQRRKSQKEEWVVSSVSFAVGLLGLLSSIGSEDSMKEGLLGGIMQWWVGLICWVAGTLCFSYLEVRGVMQRRKIRREWDGEGGGVALAVLTRGG